MHLFFIQLDPDIDYIAPIVYKLAKSDANNVMVICFNPLHNISNEHKNNYGLMQIDQRGAKEKCSGTTENLLIDDMVLKDACDGKQNISWCWIDVKKAYDSLSHSLMEKIGFLLNCKMFSEK